MLVRTFTCSLLGIRALKVSIEVHISQGIRFFIIGLADHAIRESQQRIESAFSNSGFEWPRYRIIINLAPADVRKEGSHFDLSLALGLLGASGQVPVNAMEDLMIFGELSLDGSVKAVRGLLPMVLKAVREGFEGVMIPRNNYHEASVVEDIHIIPVAHLKEAVEFLQSGQTPSPPDRKDKPVYIKGSEGPDFADVAGQEEVKRALMIAAAGKHNILLLGPPGSGKSMMARRLAGILPPPAHEESIQTTVIHSVAGNVDPRRGLILSRPFRSPHHSCSAVAMAGGGSQARPGEISLAHNGILFLDELPEFKRQVLENLRQPMEEKKVHISRATYQVSFPSDFMLVAAMNPCPCGYLTHERRPCRCSPPEIDRYMARISGPLLDRIDMHVEVKPVAVKDLPGTGDGSGKEMDSKMMRERVMKARELQAKRFQREAEGFTNASMGAEMRKRFCTLDPQDLSLLRKACERLGLSARAYDRILKVSRTIADLEGAMTIGTGHISEAISYRNLDREQWLG